MATNNRYNDFESACLHGNLEQVQTLLPENLNYRIDYELSPDGETPLILAIKSKELAVVQYLLDKGADPHLKSDVGPLNYMKWHEGIQDEEPLFIAASHGTFEIVELLLSQEVSVNLLTPLGGSSLNAAVRRSNLPTVQILLKHDADPNLYRPSVVLSGIPLFWAATQGQLAILKELIDYGANVNAQNSEGETALFWAYSDSLHFKVVKELVNRGINVQARNKQGQTALALALQHKSQNIVELLQAHGATE